MAPPDRIPPGYYGPQQPCVKHTAPGPQSALVVQTVKVQISCTQALPSTVDTHAQPPVPAAHEVRQPVPDVGAQTSPTQVGTQNERGVTHVPLPLQNLPCGQQVVPAGPGQQVVPGAQQTTWVGPEQIRLTSPPHSLQA